MATGPDESGAQQAHKTRRVRDSVHAKGFHDESKYRMFRHRDPIYHATKHDFKEA